MKNFRTKKCKNNKTGHSFKGFASTFNIEILNSFNPEPQPKDIESSVKVKLKELLTQLKGFKLLKKLALVFKKIESEDKSKYKDFYSSRNNFQYRSY